MLLNTIINCNTVIWKCFIIVVIVELSIPPADGGGHSGSLFGRSRGGRSNSGSRGPWLGPPAFLSRRNRRGDLCGSFLGCGSGGFGSGGGGFASGSGFGCSGSRGSGSGSSGHGTGGAWRLSAFVGTLVFIVVFIPHILVVLPEAGAVVKAVDCKNKNKKVFIDTEKNTTT